MTANKVGYEVDGTVVETLKDLAPLLNVSRVTTKDVEEGGQYADAVNLIDLEAVAESDESDMDEDEAWENEKLKVDKKEEAHPMESNVDPDKIFTTLEEGAEIAPKEEIMKSFPEFSDLEELKDFIKDLDTPTLEYLATGLELEWTPTYHANIHRMRIAMAMHKHFFPELFEPKEPKKKTRYSELSTKDLVKKAKDENIDIELTDNDAIDRMKVIMALKQGGHLEEAR